MFLPVLLFLILIPTVFASNEIDLTLSSNDLIAYTGETQSVSVTIANNQDRNDEFTISIWPRELVGVTTDLEKWKLVIDANSKQTIKIYFTVSLEAEELVPAFSIKVRSLTDENISDEETLLLRIMRKTPVFIKSVAPEEYNINPGENVKILINIINVANTRSEKYYLEAVIKRGTQMIKTWGVDTIDSIAAKSTFNLTKTYEFDKYAEPGTYIVEVTLRNETNKLVSSKSTNFNINAIYKLPTDYTDKKTTYSFLFIKTTIVVENSGNVATPEFYVTESLPKIAKLLFTPGFRPTSQNVTNGRIDYSWYIPTLTPGEKITISYRIELWKIWIIVIVIAVILYFAIRFLYTPRIVKGHKHKGAITRGKEIVILLDVKNKARHEIKDVEIKDFVPPIARVIEKFDTLKPKMRSLEGGTELVWKLGSFKPGEERLLTYRIRPVVEVVGTLNLPKAEMVYFDMKKMKKSHASKSVLIKSG